MINQPNPSKLASTGLTIVIILEMVMSNKNYTVITRISYIITSMFNIYVAS